MYGPLNRVYIEVMSLGKYKHINCSFKYFEQGSSKHILLTFLLPKPNQPDFSLAAYVGGGKNATGFPLQHFNMKCSHKN